jgi:hypothetical protein
MDHRLVLALESRYLILFLNTQDNHFIRKGILTRTGQQTECLIEQTKVLITLTETYPFINETSTIISIIISLMYSYQSPYTNSTAANSIKYDGLVRFDTEVTQEEPNIDLYSNHLNSSYQK